MGNVLDCSSDPLDQIHEPDGSRPTEVGPTGSDDARSQGSSHHRSSRAGFQGDRRDVDDAGERISPQPHRQEVLYLEKGVPLRDSVMWKLQREYYMAHHVKCWEKMVVPCFVTSNSFIARAYARVLVGFMRDWFLFSGRADQSEPMIILEIGAGHGKFSCLVLQHLLEMREFLPTLTARRETSHTSESSTTTTITTTTTTTTAAAGSAGAVVDAASAPATGADEHSSEAGGGGGGGTSAGSASTTATADMDSAADGERSRRRHGDGAADGLPFRYVVTDVAQGTLDYVRCHPSMQEFLAQGILEFALLDAEDPSPSTELLLQV
ncbi:unnamed protein product, partial [Hapterophycus canaliculatus]